MFGHIRGRKRSSGRIRRLPRFGKEVVILLALILVAATLKTCWYERLHVKTPSSILSSKWKTYSPGESQLSLSLPAEPQPVGAEIPDSDRAKIRQADRYQFALERFRVDIWNVLYADGVPTDIQQAAEGAIEGLRQSEGVTEFQDSKTLISRSGKKGMLVTGTFKRADETVDLHAILLGDGPKLWQVIITHPASDQNGSVAARRILQSIEIKE